jgi:circularly permuted ATPgrasp domain protein
MNGEIRYNEAFDDAGDARAPYRAFRDRTGYDPLHPSAETVAALTTAPLGDRYSILPIPLMLDNREYCSTIAPGVRQRALALQSLFFDLISGEHRVFRATSLPADLFPVIVEQHALRISDLAFWWRGKPREAVRFTYAADLVRGPDAQWSVLEDNVGCVGGVVDSQLVVDRFLASTGTQLDSRIPRGSGLSQAVGEFLARVGRMPASADVLALVGGDCAQNDPEASRKRQVLEALGIRTLNRMEPEEAKVRGLRVQDIGAVVNFDVTCWTPPTELADEVFGRRAVPLMTAPGVAVLGNKAWLPFVDELVAFYSGEEPILRTARTEPYQAMPDDLSSWVLKRSNGCQGAEVFFLESLSELERVELESDLENMGSASAVLQKRVSASFLPASDDPRSQRLQVELRPFVFVVGDSQFVVAEHVSGRAFNNSAGTGRGNMSQGAEYLCVVREPTGGTEL